MTKEQITMNETNTGTEQQRTCETCNMTAQGGYLNCEYTCAYKVKKLKDDLVCKTQECEELKEKIKQIRNFRDKVISQLKEEKEKLKAESFTSDELISIQEKDIDRYRKALEEIEGVLLSYHNDLYIPKNPVADEIERLILDIISKAKGGEE